MFSQALRRAVNPAFRATLAKAPSTSTSPFLQRAFISSSIKSMAGPKIGSDVTEQAERLDNAPTDEQQYEKVVKIGDKIYGIPKLANEDIPSDLQQQTGRRFDELIYELNGEVLFNREPVYALPDQGSKANPVLVPSGESSRPVGFEDPGSHQLCWFMLKENELTYVPLVDKYFKLQKI